MCVTQPKPLHIFSHTWWGGGGVGPHPHHPPPHPWDQKSEQGNGGYSGYRFPLSLSTIWGNHLPFNFMLKFPTHTPPPTLGIKNQNTGMEDIDSHCPCLLVKKQFFVISFLIVTGLNFLRNIFFGKTIFSHFMFFLRVL